MRAVVMNGGALRLVSAAWHTATGPAVKAEQAEVRFHRKGWPFRCVTGYDQALVERQGK
jgi:hypothetical protein